MLLPSARITQLKEICAEIGERYCFEFDAIGTDGDHVHIFVGSEPKLFTVEGYADHKKHCG